MRSTYGIILTVFSLILIQKSSANTYYISSSGNDTNSGTLTSLSWQSISQVNTFNFSPGDSILFKRGDVWRGQLLPQSGNSSDNIYYGAYSTGDNPTILGSENYSNISDWINVGGNIWRCNTVFSTDVGNIIFDNAVSVGFKKWNQADLLNQTDFWFDLSTNELLLYSVANPASTYSSIELALRKNIVYQENRSYITYENLSIKYGAAHGFGGGNTANITISACEISYIGGGDLNMNGIVRYGNGVEFWGNASNNKVEKCKIWEIYDTGVTNQNHTTPSTQENIRYENNLIWNCGLSSFEYWNRPATSSTSEIFFENNTCLNAGYGWGEQREDYHGIHAIIDSNPAQTDTIHIRNNIFYNAKRSTYGVEDNVNGFIDLNYNLIYQSTPSDTLFVSFPSYTIYKYSEFSDFTTNTGKDVNSIDANPNFQDIGSMDLTLSSSSQAIDNGVDVGIADDVIGNLRPFNLLYDIGAYESQLPLNINELNNAFDFRLSPNPTNNFIFLDINSAYEQENQVLIINYEGKIVNITNNYTASEYIDVSDLKKGIYFVKLMNKEVLIGAKKLIIN